MSIVYFPCPDEACGASNESQPRPAEDWIDSCTVLVVDDEAMVRDVAQMMLESFGFKAITAADGVQGLEAVRNNPAITIVLLDMTMPHLSGEDTFREMHRLRPELPVILVSGYNEQEVTDLFVGKNIAGFIQKPFQLNELLNKLSLALASPPESSSSAGK